MTDARGTAQEQQGWSALTAGTQHVLLARDGKDPAVPRLRDAAAGGLDHVRGVLVLEGVRQAPDFVAVDDGQLQVRPT